MFSNTLNLLFYFPFVFSVDFENYPDYTNLVLFLSQGDKVREIKGKDIVNFLEKKFSLKMPAYGVLAGQAVASAYFELIGSRFEPVYNDIDVFIYDRYYKVLKEYNNPNIDFLDNMHISFIKDYPETMEIPRLIFEIKKPYKILDTTRNGLLNRVMISENVSVRRVVSSFDLNCVQIGVDLSSGILYKTKKFDSYINTGVLEVVSYASPHHTAIRLLNKQHISGKNDNIEKEMLNIATFIELDNTWIKKNEFNVDKIGYFPYFGIKRFKDYEKNPSIKRYFDVYSHRDFEMFQLSPDFKTDFKIVDRNMRKFLSIDSNLFSKIGINDKEKLYLVHEYKDYFMIKKAFDKLVTMGELKMNTLERVFGKTRINNYTKETIKVLLDNIATVSSLGVNESYTLKRLSEKVLVEKLKLIEEVFENKDIDKKTRKNKLEIQDKDDIFSFKKVKDINSFLEKNGDFLSLEESFKNNIYRVKFSREMGFGYANIVFSVDKGKLVFLNKNNKLNIKKDKIKQIEDIVNSDFFKKFFLSK